MRPFNALFLSKEKVFVAVGNKPPRIPDANDGSRGCIELLDRLHIHRVSTVDKFSQVSGLLVPIQGRILGDLTVEADIEKKVEARGCQRLQEARVGTTDLVTVEVAVSLLTNLLQEFLIIDGPHELDAWIGLEVRFPLEFCEEGVVHSRHEREIPLGVGSHELPNHGLVVVLGHEASYNQVIAEGLEALLGEPSRELRVVVSER